MFFNSPLQRAIARGMKPGGDLAEELIKLNDYPVRSRKDAKAIVAALRKLPLAPRKTSKFSSPLQALVLLFQNVDSRDCAAFQVLYDDGLRELMRIFDARLQHSEDSADDLLFVLKILAMYGSRDGVERIVVAARQPFMPDAYLWHVILSVFSEGHSHAEYLFDRLSDPLPTGFLAIALLDSANGAAFKSGLQRHPFDSPSGWERLQQWLDDRDPDHFSYARSSATALPFLSNPSRDQLMAIAMDHVDANVQLEAAWAAARLGREGGLKILGRFCLDVNHSDAAQRLLVELDRADMIPDEATNPTFQAKAEFARWLAHPCELGKPPDELDLLDQRQLAWPPDREPKQFFLFRFCLRDRSGLEHDQIDCGVVGSMTWCFFYYKMCERPPEDVYAIHCYWEMKNAKLLEEVEVVDAAEYAMMLTHWQNGNLQEAKITRVVEASPQLKLPTRLVAIASAKLDGEEGWAVLDGPRSAWYPKIEQPEGSCEQTALMIHVGRQLLGFQDQPNRKAFLIEQRPPREPLAIIAAYEKFMTEAAQAAPKRQEELLGSFGLLPRHFEDYVDALTTVRGASKSANLMDAYERFLNLSENVHESVRLAVHSLHSVLGKHFNSYVEALASCQRSADAVVLIEQFAIYWKSNLGYSVLGIAALKAGHYELAEPFLTKLRNEMESYFRGEDMSLLARIWFERGKSEQARELLVDCMQKLMKQIQESKYNSDRDILANDFRLHRTTFLQLFRDGDQELKKLEIPIDPLENLSAS
jgi:hypothetical protein